MDKIVMIDRSTLSRKEDQMLKIIFWSQAKKEAERQLELNIDFLNSVKNGEYLVRYNISELENCIKNSKRLVRFCNERGLIATSNILMR